MLLLPFTLCIPLDLSPDVHYVSNYASRTIYPMHFIRTVLRSSFLSDVVLRLVVIDVRRWSDNAVVLASKVFFVDISTLEDGTSASSRNAWQKLPNNTVPRQRKMKMSKPTGIFSICSKYKRCSDSLEDVPSWLFEPYYESVGIVHSERRQPCWLWVRRRKEQLRNL